jgi:carnitine-CoA ligase
MFSASRFVDHATCHGATCASLFAGPIRMILARGGPPAPDAPPLQLRHCWYAQNLTPGQYDSIADWLGCPPRQLYGMTETIPAVLTDEREAPRCDTMGYVTPGCVVDLQDGEIVVGGERGVTLFAGYLDDPATTDAAFRDGWFLTGDRATRDEHGRYRFAGRRSDVLKVAGENVSVVEVEQVLAMHPGVADVAVVGAPDPIRDEVPVAVVVPAPDATDPERLRAELEAWCAERLGKAKRPRDFRFVDELPRTSVGKIKKYQLRPPA